MHKKSAGVRKFFFLTLISILFFSCSQNLPEINNVNYSYVFDFASETDLPEIRLGVYVDVTSDVHRADKIRIECRSNDYEWECLNPVKLSTGGKGKKQYAGYSHFVMPDNRLFPQGQFVVYYTDLNGNEESCQLNIYGDTKIAEMKAPEAEKYLKEKGAVENWVLYDENDVMVYFGAKEGDMKSLDFAWNRYNKAVKARTVWTQNNGRLLCTMPPQYKNNIKTETDAGEVNAD